MINSDIFYCFKTFYMESGDVAFEKGKFYDGYMIKEDMGTFNSEIGNNHVLSLDYIIEHLKVFKFGR